MSDATHRRKRLVVKIGSALLVDRQKGLKQGWLSALAMDVAEAKATVISRLEESGQGKGTIQSSPQRLSDGSAVVITVAKLVCGDGSCFDGTGLTVDVERALSAEEATNFYDYTPQTDPQVQRAVSAAQQLSGTTTLAGASSAAAADSAASSAAADDTAPAEAAEGETAASEPETAASAAE